MKSRFERSVELVIALLFASLCLVMLAQIIGRSFFNTSIQWSEEYTRYAFIWITFLASGLAVKRKAHMGFDFLVNKLSKKAQFAVEMMVYAASTLFLALFFYNGLILVLGVGSAPSPVMHIPMSIIYSILPLSALIMFIFLVEAAWKDIRNARNPGIADNQSQEKGELS